MAFDLGASGGVTVPSVSSVLPPASGLESRCAESPAVVCPGRLRLRERLLLRRRTGLARRVPSCCEMD